MCGYCMEMNALGYIYSKPFEKLELIEFNAIDPYGREIFFYPELIYTDGFGIDIIKTHDRNSTMLLWAILQKAHNTIITESERKLCINAWNQYKNNKTELPEVKDLYNEFPGAFNLLRNGPLSLVLNHEKKEQSRTHSSDIIQEVERLLRHLITYPNTHDINDEDDIPYASLNLHPAFDAVKLEIYFLTYWLLQLAPTSTVLYEVMNGLPDCPDPYSSFMAWRRYIAWEIYCYQGRYDFLKRAKEYAPICLACIAQHERHDNEFVTQIYSILKDMNEELPFEHTGYAIDALKLIVNS